MKCPHCREPHPDNGYHVCADKTRWTQTERDEWRRQVEAESPWIRWAPSTQSMAERFGGR